MWAGDAVDASNLCCDSQGKIQSVTQKCSISVCPQILLVVSWWWDSFMGVWFDHLKHQGRSEFLVCDLSHEWEKFQGTALPTSSVDTCQWQQARLKTRHLLQFLCLQLAPSSQSSPSPVSFSGLGQLRPPIQRVPKPNVPCATETLIQPCPCTTGLLRTRWFWNPFHGVGTYSTLYPTCPLCPDHKRRWENQGLSPSWNSCMCEWAWLWEPLVWASCVADSADFGESTWASNFTMSQARVEE